MKRLLVRRPRQLEPCRLEQRLDDVGRCALTRLAATANAMPLDSSSHSARHLPRHRLLPLLPWPKPLRLLLNGAPWPRWPVRESIIDARKQGAEPLG
jgi:hypothetical protein